jgi:UDP-2,3-diacylglucosamine hydrolase
LHKEIIFISDLHLSLNKKEIINSFLSFLKNEARQANAIYILGDLFDAWVGDDDNTPPNKHIKNELKNLTEWGVQVFFQQGNRDFLLGRHFCAETGVILLDDYAVIELNGAKTLLTHGDLLCTQDLPYQEFRKKSRTNEWQKNILSKPLLIRLIAARWYRFRSYFHKRQKNQEIMDVDQQTVMDEMIKHECTQLIHGHTHRPATHHFEINGQPAQRIVLAQWEQSTIQSILRWNAMGFTTEEIACKK